MKSTDFTIIVDTREQQPWTFHNHTTAKKKLDTGDYSIEGLEHLLGIERKKSVSEFANNIVESRFQDVVSRLSQLKYGFILFEFDLQDVLIYPIGSTVPKKWWNNIKVTPSFIMKHIIELQLLHNIKIEFCGSAANAEKMAEHILKKVHYFERVKEQTNI
jgi:ERCC4-type nuclease